MELLCASWSLSQLFCSPPYHPLGISEKASPQKQTSDSHNAADVTPVTVVVNQPRAQPQKEAAQDNMQNWPPIWSNWALVLVAAVTAWFALRTLNAIRDQVIEMRKTGEQTEKLIQENMAQSTSLELSVKESARLASAMEIVAKEIAISAKAATHSVAALKERTAKQMRAYLTVIIGGGVYQERDKNYRFEGKPIVINTGHTPARNVRHRCKAQVLPIPLPSDFAFPLPEKEFGGTMMGPQQNNILGAIVDDFCDDAEVNDIKSANGKGLYVWGTITYEDIFGERQRTEFCQVIRWTPDNKIWGYFIPGHSDAT
jgi:hypothetical protein